MLKMGAGITLLTVWDLIRALTIEIYPCMVSLSFILYIY